MPEDSWKVELSLVGEHSAEFGENRKGAGCRYWCDFNLPSAGSCCVRMEIHRNLDRPSIFLALSATNNAQ